MKDNLPNLELLQERFYNKIKDIYNKEITIPDMEVYVFPQIWGSTSTGFDDAWGGCSLRKGYTTVIIDETLKLAGVFFGEKLSYIVNKPTYAFYEDIHKQTIAGLSVAKDKYEPVIMC